MAYYTYIESWTLTYTLKSLKGDFLGMDLDGLDSFFNNYVDLGSGNKLSSLGTISLFSNIIHKCIYSFTWSQRRNRESSENCDAFVNRFWCIFSHYVLDYRVYGLLRRLFNIHWFEPPLAA